MKTMRHRAMVFATTLILPATLVLTACGSSNKVAPQRADAQTLDQLYDAAVKSGQTTVTIYGPGEAVYKPVYADFNKRFPNIKINGDFLFGGELEARLQQEAATGKHVGDLIHFDDAIRYQKMMQPIELVGVDKVPNDVKLFDGKLYVTSKSLFGFAYNANRLSPEKAPSSWAAIVDQGFSAKIGLSDPTGLGSTPTVLYSAYEGKVIDDSWLKSLKDKQIKIYRSNSQMVGALATGEIDFTPVVYFGYLKTFQAQGANLKFITPSDGAALTDTPYGLLEGAPSPFASSLLVSWLLTPEGQKSLVDNVSEYGSMPNAPAPAGLTQQADLKLLPLAGPDNRIAKKEKAADFFKKFF